jgi:hypothetical protein
MSPYRLQTAREGAVEGPRHRLLPMVLAGVAVRDELVQRLGYLVGDSDLPERSNGDSMRNRRSCR